MSQTELDNIFDKVMDSPDFSGMFNLSEHSQLKSVAMGFLREVLTQVKPTQEQFNKIKDLRPYLLHTPNDHTADALHYLGDAAQKWHQQREESLKQCGFTHDDWYPISQKEDLKDGQLVLGATEIQGCKLVWDETFMWHNGEFVGAHSNMPHDKITHFMIKPKSLVDNIVVKGHRVMVVGSMHTAHFPISATSAKIDPFETPKTYTMTSTKVQIPEHHKKVKKENTFTKAFQSKIKNKNNH